MQVAEKKQTPRSQAMTGLSNEHSSDAPDGRVRRLAERGLKPERKKKAAKSKGKKAVQPTLFSPGGRKGEAAKKRTKVKAKFGGFRHPVITRKRQGNGGNHPQQDAEVRSCPVGNRSPPKRRGHGTATRTMTRRMPSTAVWTGETNPPINGFYEMMMYAHAGTTGGTAPPGSEKMDANAAKQAAGTTEAKKEKAHAENRQNPSYCCHDVYPMENGFEAERERRNSVVEEMQRGGSRPDTGRAATPEREAMMPRPFSRPLEPHLKDGSLAWEHTGGVRSNQGAC